MAYIVFTDLDGTLLDHDTYSYEKARPALEALKKSGTPLVLTSSKTRAEMLPLWLELSLNAPFITENGGAAFVPQKHSLARDPAWEDSGDDLACLRMGLGIEEIREKFAAFKDKFQARGFGDMTDREVADLTRLPIREAALARMREFDEPVMLPDPDINIDEFTKEAKRNGLSVSRGGRFLHLMQGADKGTAVKKLIDIYAARTPGLVSVALGDSPNDLPMFLAVDKPFLVAKPGGSHSCLMAPRLTVVPDVGPKGFNRSILSLDQVSPQ